MPTGCLASFGACKGREKIEGIGVGLAAVARIVQKHGGRIWAEAEKDPRGGSLFHSLNRYCYLGTNYAQRPKASAASELAGSQFPRNPYHAERRRAISKFAPQNLLTVANKTMPLRPV
jgi:hypothetical protein